MKDRALLKRIALWRTKVGRGVAEKRLLAVGISLSMAQKLLAGSYEDQPKIDKIKAIEQALKWN